MSRCPYCNKLLKPGATFCRGHNIAYKARMTKQWNVYNNIEAKRELIKYGWLEEVVPAFQEISYKFRKFGIELETVSSNHTSVAKTIDFVRTFGINIDTVDYTHRTTSFWKVTTDASLTNGYGREFVSPPFTEESAAFIEIRKMCDAMSLLNVSVNSSCGFHVHLDISDLTPKQVARVLKFYQVYESDIDKLHQNSRRGQNLRYCGGLASYTLNPDSISNLNQLTSLFSTRYLKVNIQAYLRHGTLEFRQHGGTVNALKIINWVKFCTRVIEYAKTDNIISRDIDLFTALNLSEEEKFYWNVRKEQLRGGVA